MRKIVCILITTIVIASSGNIYSQTKKFGHINTNDLVKMMPERDSALNAMQIYTKELEDQLTTMRAELETKYSDYLKQEASLNELVKQSKQKELQDLNNRIEEFQTGAQDNLRRKESELLQPIIDKANKAIQDVGKEKGYLYIFDVSTGAVVYFSNDSEDVTPFVKIKLGLK